MEIGSVGSGPGSFDAGLSALSRATAAKGPEIRAGLPPAAIGADTVAGLLRDISASEMTWLLNIVDPVLPPEKVTQLDQLVREIVTAAQGGDVNGALVKLAAFAPLDPPRAEHLASEPSLAPIQKQAAELLVRLSTTARVDAETHLQQALQRVQEPGFAERPIDGMKPATLVLLAERLVDAGGYANWIHSAEISQKVIDPSLWAPPPMTLERLPEQDKVSYIAGMRSRAALASLRLWSAATVKGVKKLWRRAPLLALLLGWLLAGLVAAVIALFLENDLPASVTAWGFEIWALGFLALVGFGFYARVRNR